MKDNNRITKHIIYKILIFVKPYIICFIGAAAAIFICFDCYCQETKKEEEPESLEYQELLNKYKQVKADRDNLVFQAKRLLDFKRQHEGLVQNVGSIKTEKDALEAKNKELSEGMKKLEDDAQALKQEKTKLEEFADKSTIKSAIDKLIDEKNAEIKEMQYKLKNEITKLKDEIDAIGAEYEDEISSVKDRYKIEKKDWEQTAGELTHRIDDIRKESVKLDKIKDINELKISDMQDEITYLDKEIKEADKDAVYLNRNMQKVPEQFNLLAYHNKTLIENTAKMHYNLGVFYCSSKDFGRAVEEFKQTIDIRPNDKDAIFNLGLIYAEHQIDKAKAIEYFKKYIQLDNRSVNADFAKQYIMKWEAWRRDANDILR